MPSVVAVCDTVCGTEEVYGVTVESSKLETETLSCCSDCSASPSRKNVLEGDYRVAP